MSGNSLGGVIKTPFGNGLFKKDGSKDYVNDYYEVGKTKLYVSNGLGYEGIQFRLLNIPSINVYRFK